MQIHNIRIGFATNSSSQHSLIFLPGIKDSKVSDGFGWDNFTAASETARKRYLGCLLRQNLHLGEWGEIIIQSLLGKECKTEDYVDHESVIAMPCTFGKTIPDPEFFAEFKEWFLQKDLVVLGGNDNNAKEHPLASKGSKKVVIPYDINSHNLVCRKDKDYWILFDRTCGTKVRFSFANPFIQCKLQSSEIPELIDIKITSVCGKGCNWCYQQSTTKGKHGDTKFIRDLTYNLAADKVFEVAFGGGEPTQHPDFIEILKHYHSYGITPSFSTRNLEWLKDDKEREAILSHCGGFAYSLEYDWHVEKLAAYIRTFEINPYKVAAQIVVGVTEADQLIKTLKACKEHGISVTLLGYKDCGRGKDYRAKKIDISKMLKVCADMSLSVDSVFLQQHKKEIKAAKVPDWCYDEHEGGFSMYIDAVEQTAGPTSYCDPKQMIPFCHPLKELFAKVKENA